MREEKDEVARLIDENWRRAWPVPLKPLEDELLSSWLVRLSGAHGLTLSSFCNAVWPKKGVRLLDLEVLPKAEILNTLAEKTRTPMTKVEATTLTVYDGRLFIDTSHRQIQWVLRYGRDRNRETTQCGLQYCPDCLREDEEPYFRREWRLALVVICPQHRLQLHDCCHRCGQAVRLIRSVIDDTGYGLSGTITTCWNCRVDLRDMPENLRVSVPPAELEYQQFLLESPREGWVEIRGDGPVFSYLYFDGLYQVLVLLLRPGSKGRRSIQQQAFERYGLSSSELALPERPLAGNFMRLGVAERRKLLSLASQLLADWPNEFLAFCRANNFGYTEVGRFNRTLPYWFYRVVYEQLSRGRYCYTKQEFDSIIDYLQRKNGHAPTRQEVLPYLSDGLRDIRFGAWEPIRTWGKKRECPYCQKTTIYRRAGFVPTNGKPRFKCTQCQRSYTLNSTQVFHTKEERSTAFQLYVEGHRISDIALRLSVSRTAVRNWIKAEAHQTPGSESVLLLLMRTKIERECPYCQQITIHGKAGFVAGSNKPRFKCKQCQRAYTPNRSMVVHTKEERLTAFQLYVEGHRISDIARRLEVSETAVRGWIRAHQASESPSA
ncbi:MAG: TniQ family protein [Acidobacteria bacterium]|nr:TniQ family protein [Acidobacteriota bacterium]